MKKYLYLILFFLVCVPAIAGTINSYTLKSPPDDADTIVIYDSDDGSTKKIEVGDISGSGAGINWSSYPDLTALTSAQEFLVNNAGTSSSINWEVVQTQLPNQGWTDSGANVYNTTTSDNIGIGTFSPSSKLQVVGTIDATAFVGDGAGITGISGGFDITSVDRTAYSNEAQNTTHSTQILTYNGNQYLGYIDSDRKLQLCKRPTGGQFTCYKYDGLGGRPSISDFQIDNHNTIALGVDENGYIHVTYDMHGVALKYRVSSSPEDVSNLGSASTFLGTNEDAVAYPMFFNDTSGGLYVVYRNGTSGNGDHYFYKYNAGTTSWSAMTGTGTAGLFIDGVTTSKSAYVNHPIVTSDNVAHFAWIWRNDSTPDSAEDVIYINYNLTTGVATKYTGASQTIPITSSNDTPALTIATGSGLLNGTSKYGLALDSSGNPSIVYNKDDDFGNTNVYLVHYNGSSWSNHLVTKSGKSSVIDDSDTTAVLASPAVVYDSSDNAIVIYHNSTLSQGVLGFEASNSDLDSWSAFTIYAGSTGKMSIAFDGSLWNTTKILNLIISPVTRLYTPTSIDGDIGTPLFILKWDSNINNRYLAPFNMTKIVTPDDVTLYSIEGSINMLGNNISATNGLFQTTAEDTDTTKIFNVRNATPTDLFTVLGNGNVGINTTSPELPLMMKCGTSVCAKIIRTDSQSSTGGALFFVGTDTGAVMSSGNRLGLIGLSGPTNTTHTYAHAAFISSFARSTWTASNAEADLRFSTTPNGATTASTRMTIGSSGNVGIGTTSPGATLDIGTGNLRIGIGTTTAGTLVCVKSISGGTSILGYCTGSLTDSICGTCN